jgi:hypothetical protein
MRSGAKYSGGTPQRAAINRELIRSSFATSPATFRPARIINSSACFNSLGPGGNVTGLSLQEIDTAGKRLEMLREVIPNLRRLAIVANSSNSSSALEMREVQKAADKFGLEAISLDIQRAEEITPALARFSHVFPPSLLAQATVRTMRWRPLRLVLSTKAISLR